MTHGDTHAIPRHTGLRTIALIVALVLSIAVVIKAVHVDFRVVAPVLSFVLVAGLAQIAIGTVPTMISVLVGTIVFPASALINPLFDGRMRLQPVGPIDLLYLVVCGALAGYCSGVLLVDAFKLADGWQKDGTKTVYAVPRRFGMSTILIATTVFAVVFAMMEYARARPWQMFFFTSFVATVAIAQAVLNHNPRWASMLSGALYLPLSIVLFSSSMGRRSELPRVRFDNLSETMLLLGTFAAVGVLVGYLGGALIAGVFLVSDYAARFFVSRGSLPNSLQTTTVEEDLLPSSTLSLLAERAAASRRET